MDRDVLLFIAGLYKISDQIQKYALLSAQTDKILRGKPRSILLRNDGCALIPVASYGVFARRYKRNHF
jgi:hypothetical protein